MNKLLDTQIIWEDDNLAIIHKPFTVPVQPDKTDSVSLMSQAETYYNKSLYLTTRLDRPAMGLVIFTKKKDYVKQITDAFYSDTIQKKYIAIVEGKISTAEGELNHLLFHNKRTMKSCQATLNQKDAKEASLTFKVIKAFDRYTALEIELKTGRFHQIRSQLSIFGHPIKGDIKYGARRKNNDRSIHLWCHQININTAFASKEITDNPKNVNDTLWIETMKTLA